MQPLNKMGEGGQGPSADVASDSSRLSEDQWARVKDIFHEALERSAAGRKAFIREACEGDAALEAALESLLASDDSAREFLETPAVARVGLPSHPTATLAPGDRLGAYEIVALLGAGGMGVVYRARDARLERDVALKVLPVQVMNDTLRRQWLTREAQAAAALDHPNICPIFDIGEHDGRVWIAMQYVEGETLAERLRRGPLELPLALDVATQIASALSAAHARGIVHRDVKPENIMITATAHAKLLDFGLARITAEQSADSPHPGHGGLRSRKLGTLPYMSPEQVRGESLDARTDVFSFGAVLFELITGHRAFVGESDADVTAAILSSTPLDINAFAPRARRALGAIIHKCLEQDRKSRYWDGQALAEGLAAATQRLQLGANRSGSTGRRERPSWKTAVFAAALLLSVGTVVASIARIVAIRFNRQAGLAGYTQLTDFTDAVSAPSLSADGRMLTFIRSDKLFLAAGQIYVKRLPKGDARQLTNTPQLKLAPVFSPDGSHITYTELASPREWDTWSVPVTGGSPTRLVPGASGLVWLDARHLMYSEFRSPGPHMGIVTSTLAGAERREIYFPQHTRGMAHYSYASPDRRWVLTVEMDVRGQFAQCRLVRFDGGAGRDVGPPGSCTSTAWSPDGRWMYFTVEAGGHSHLWRQSFPDGTPQQLTFGPTEEEGVTVAPDGRSLITSIGQRHSAIWLHTTAGERAVTSEGFAFAPRMSPDDGRVFYLLRKSLASPVTELYSTDLVSGVIERHLPGIAIAERHYDISRDGQEVVYATNSPDGRPAVWIARIDRRTPPRLVAKDATMVSFGAHDDLFFVSLGEKTSQFVHSDVNGEGRVRISDFGPIINRGGAVSPDGSLVILYASLGDLNPATFAVPVGGGDPQKICTVVCGAWWSGDGTHLFVNITDQRTLVLPISPGRMLPDLPAGGLDISPEGLAITGMKVLEESEVVPSRDPSTYVYVKRETRKNLYRIPLQ